MRGWSHAAAAVAALASTVALTLHSAADTPRLVSMLVYGLSMVELFAVSATYHLGPWGPALRERLRALDHASIFVLIAGTYTPICVNVLDGPLRSTVLTIIWTLALVGVAGSAFTGRLPRWVRSGLYLGMGGVALLPLPSLMEQLPTAAILTIAAGGLFYAVGAVIYALRRPDPFPRVFGFHEVFHLLVIAGGAAFLAAIWIWVLPFPRGA